MSQVFLIALPHECCRFEKLQVGFVLASLMVVLGLLVATDLLARHFAPGQAGISVRAFNTVNITRRHLHPALQQLVFINSSTGTYKAANHAFRRFRNTDLRNRTACPEGLRRFWMGHADESMDDLYDKIKEDVEFRKEWAERCGFGFNLPPVVPNVPKKEEKTARRESRLSYCF
jgi:hypothetical protein